MAPAKDFKVAVIGGGIAGITLAVALQKRNIHCDIYEQGRAFGEIGAGVSFGPNAVRAMRACDDSVYDAYQRVATRNQWESKKRVYFDFLDGTHRSRSSPLKTIFTLTNEEGQNGVHRAHFMEEMAKLVRPDSAHFGKHLDNITEDPKTGKLKLVFDDESSAEADAVIGCDGIKSRTRALVVGEKHPSAKAKYSHWYAYRGVIPMSRAVGIVGEERAANACLWMGPKAHLLTFPINRGDMMNLVGFVQDRGIWPSSDYLTLPAKKEEALHDFRAFGPAIQKHLELINDKLDRWAIFDLGDNPVPSFYKGRIAISGDAAHATTPHHGAGAGFGIEDSAILACLLSDPRVSTADDIESAFATFDACRRRRGQWLVEDSRRTGMLYEWSAEGVGNDMDGIKNELEQSFASIWDFDMNKALREAQIRLGTFLAGCK